MNLQEKICLLKEFLAELEVTIEAGVGPDGEPWLTITDYLSGDVEIPELYLSGN
jgi:hypothetical protein